MVTEVGHRLFCLRRRQMLEHLQADDEIVALRQRLGGRAHPTVGANVRVHLRDGVFGDVQTVRLHATPPQSLNQKPHRAAHVQDRPRSDGLDDPLRYAVEELQPLGVALVGASTAVAEVVSIVQLTSLHRPSDPHDDHRPGRQADGTDCRAPGAVPPPARDALPS